MENISTTEKLRDEFLKSWNYEILHFSPELIASVIDAIGKQVADSSMAYDLLKEQREQIYNQLVIKYQPHAKNLKHLEAVIFTNDDFKEAKIKCDKFNGTCPTNKKLVSDRECVNNECTLGED